MKRKVFCNECVHLEEATSKVGGGGAGGGATFNYSWQCTPEQQIHTNWYGEHEVTVYNYPHIKNKNNDCKDFEGEKE